MKYNLTKFDYFAELRLKATLWIASMALMLMNAKEQVVYPILSALYFVL